MPDDISKCEMGFFGLCRASVKDEVGLDLRENLAGFDLFNDFRDVRANGDEALSVVRDAQISKINDGRSDGVP